MGNVSETMKLRQTTSRYGTNMIWQCIRMGHEFSVNIPFDRFLFRNFLNMINGNVEHLSKEFTSPFPLKGHPDSITDLS